MGKTKTSKARAVKSKATKTKRAKLPKPLPRGTIRVEAKTLTPFVKTSSKQNTWQKITLSQLHTLKQFQTVANRLKNIKLAVKLFKAHKSLNILIDTKNPRWLKGHLTKEGLERGARINILPNGEILSKAFSLFAPHLTFHDQLSHDHWDLIYQNKGGTYSYVYTKEKLLTHKKAKYSKVDLFEQSYKTLQRKLSKSIKEVNTKNLTQKDILLLAMYTLCKTNMRIGNITYFKAHKHKGLTTLKKSDITINKETTKNANTTKNNKQNTNSTVTFNYIGKDGVPLTITKTFNDPYIKALKTLLKQKTNDQFIFTTKNGKPLPEHKFKELFKELTGHEFYPHIIRSFTATSMLKKELHKLEKQNIKAISKQEKQTILLSIAHELGHKKFDKKTQEWHDSFSVTVNNYIRPDLVEQLNNITK